MSTPAPEPPHAEPIACASAGKAHSAELFGSQRDFWWNRDFLDLMAARLRLGEASSLADIGCGQGHWSRLLYPYLRPPAKLAGVDREARWVTTATEYFRMAFPASPQDAATFLRGEATDIPLPADAFEVVTCQTVLMHVSKPQAALKEMLRILRPGGLLLCAEPSNLWNHMPMTSLSADESVEALVRRFEFELRCHRGRIQAGEGDHSLGDLLPGMLAAAGLIEIAVYQSDRPHPLFPPYQTPAQKALLDQERQWQANATGPFEADKLRRHFLAGGGYEKDFAGAFAELLERYQREQAALAAGTFHAAFGTLHYLVSGRKP